MATISAPAAWVAGEQAGATVAVAYGLSSSGPWTTESEAVTPMTYAQLAFTNNFLVTVPSAPLRPGATFPINVIGRAAQDLESAKIMVVFSGTDDSNVVVSLAAGITTSKSDTWRYQTTTKGNTLTVVLNRRPNVAALTSSAQEDQEIFSANVVLLANVPAGVITVQMRVRALCP